MKSLLFAIVAGMLASHALPAAAHHSGSQYDLTKRDMNWTGVVREFKAINPHTHIVLEVKDATGVHDITFEGQSMSNMYRAGWRPNSIKVGDTVTINAAPRKDGANGGFVLSITTTKGQKF